MGNCKEDCRNREEERADWWNKLTFWSFHFEFWLVFFGQLISILTWQGLRKSRPQWSENQVENTNFVAVNIITILLLVVYALWWCRFKCWLRRRRALEVIALIQDQPPDERAALLGADNFIPNHAEIQAEEILIAFENFMRSYNRRRDRPDFQPNPGRLLAVLK